MAEKKQSTRQLVKIGKSFKKILKDENGQYKDEAVERGDASLFVNKITTKNGEFMTFDIVLKGERYQGFLEDPKTEEEKQIYRQKLEEARLEAEKLKQ